MYTKSTEEKEFGMIPKNDKGDFIKVVRVTPVNGKGPEALDVRNYYTGADGKVYPNQKGVRFNEEIAVEVGIAILEAMTVCEFNSVMEHFDNQEEVENDEV